MTLSDHDKGALAVALQHVDSQVDQATAAYDLADLAFHTTGHDTEYFALQPLRDKRDNLIHTRNVIQRTLDA